MKHVVSISLGSSTRNKTVEVVLLEEKIKIERIGTDGDKKKARQLFLELDQKVDAFGIGGTDLYLRVGTKIYILKDTANLVKDIRTPVADGSGLKNTLESKIAHYLIQEGIDVKNKNVFVVSAVDRYGMAESFVNTGCKTSFGDLIFALHIPLELKSLKQLNYAAGILLPIISGLPIEMIYPVGKKQEKHIEKFERFFAGKDIIAGDFHYIKRYTPQDLAGKIIVTNTITSSDREDLKERGVSCIVTTTPKIDGRSYGTNVIEAVLMAMGVPEEEYVSFLEEKMLVPSIDVLK